MKRLLIAIALLLCATIARAPMSAHYINIGQPDSILLESERAAILIDGDSESIGDDRYKNPFVSYLN